MHRLDLWLIYVECVNLLSTFIVQNLGCALCIVPFSWAHVANVSGCVGCTWKKVGNCQYVPIHVVYAVFCRVWQQRCGLKPTCKALTTPRTKATKHYHKHWVSVKQPFSHATMQHGLAYLLESLNRCIYIYLDIWIQVTSSIMAIIFNLRYDSTKKAPQKRRTECQWLHNSLRACHVTYFQSNQVSWVAAACFCILHDARMSRHLGSKAETRPTGHYPGLLMLHLSSYSKLLFNSISESEHDDSMNAFLQPPDAWSCQKWWHQVSWY